MIESEETISFSDTIFTPNYQVSWQPCHFEWTREEIRQRLEFWIISDGHRDSLDVLWVGHGLENRGIVVRFPTGAGDLAFLQSVQNVSEAHIGTHCAMTNGLSCCRGEASGKWSWPLTCIQCQGQKRMELYRHCPAGHRAVQRENLPSLTATSKMHFYNSHVSLLLSLHILVHIERKKPKNRSQILTLGLPFSDRKSKGSPKNHF